MASVQEDRFEFIKSYVDEYIKANSGIAGLKIIFVAESIIEARKLAGKMKNYESYLRNCLLFTADKLVEEYGLKGTFLQYKEVDDKVTLVQASLDV
jgi:hypothetical protein